MLHDTSTLGADSAQFYIPINYRLAIVKNPQKADIVISSGKAGKEALIIEVTKDSNKTHPYRRTELVEVVNNKLGGIQTINFFDILCIKRVYNIEKQAEFCYLPKFSSPQYSDNFVNWILQKAKRNPTFFNQTRKKAKKISD